MDQPVSIRSLLDAAVHFGHQTRRWNPKMKPYIFGERNGVYILNLKKTMINLDQAYSFIRNIVSRDGVVLFVGTKKQAQEPISINATNCEMPYVNHRWLGGMLTNFVTIRARVTRMEELEAMEAEGRLATLPKKEQITLKKELGKLRDNLDGIRKMKNVPQAIFVVDTHREMIAIREARRLGIPVVGIIDTNSDPDDVDFGIPGNDDAIRSVNLITEVIAAAVLAGKDKTQISESEMAGGEDAAETQAMASGQPGDAQSDGNPNNDQADSAFTADAADTTYTAYSADPGDTADAGSYPAYPAEYHTTYDQPAGGADLGAVAQEASQAAGTTESAGASDAYGLDTANQGYAVEAAPAAAFAQPEPAESAAIDDVSADSAGAEVSEDGQTEAY